MSDLSRQGRLLDGAGYVGGTGGAIAWSSVKPPEAAREPMSPCDRCGGPWVEAGGLSGWDHKEGCAWSAIKERAL